MATSPLWSKTSAENLVRHRSGTLYLSAKIAGKKVRFSLKTDNLKVAKIARDEKLKELRESIDRGPQSIITVGDALAIAERRARMGVDLKESTREFYQYMFIGLRKTLPVESHGSVWTHDIAVEWWQGFATKYSVNHANTGLRMVKQMAEELHKAGLCKAGTMKGLRRRRTEDKAVKGLPSKEQLDELIENIRGQRKGASEQAADLVEFLAWSGLRIGEAVEVQWEDVGPQFLKVTGGPLKTKNHQIRMVPLNRRLQDVLERRKYEGATGLIFTMKTPRDALANACKRLGLAHLKVHDLRHWFATRAIETGVDIPTVAKWLGHSDGGALVMKTYGHLRDEHSLEAARRMM